MPGSGCVRCSRRPRWPSWLRVSAATGPGSSRWWLVSGRRWCRCRLPRPGCGSLTSWRGRHRFTTWRWRCGCPGALMPRRWARRWPMWWVVMRVCARCSRRLTGYLSSWWCRPSGPISAGRSSMAATGRPAGWRRPARNAARHPFDLTTEIPLRARLFRVADDEHVLVVVVHHIAADGLSLTPLVRDLGVAYASRCAGQAPGWADLPVQYVDYTLWQRTQLGDLDDSDSRIAAQLAYWQDVLAGMPEHLQLPTDRPYPPVADYRGATVAVDWPVELQQRLREVAAQHDATSFMVVQAALSVLLAKLSASTDVAVGFPIAGRRDPRSMSWWDFSSTRWCCGWIWPVIPRLRTCWLRCVSAAWPPMSTKTCPSRCWWSGSTPPGSSDPSSAGPGHAGLAELAGQRSRLPGWRWGICRSRRCRWTPTAPAWI